MWNKLSGFPRQQSARKQIRKSKDLKASLYGNFLSKERFSLISSTGKTFELFKMASPELDPQRCINCGECVKLCPTQAIIERQREICRICPGCIKSIQLPKEIGTAARRSCGSSCPVNMAPQSYISLIAEGKFKEALALIKRHVPLPAICGYLCDHPCEEECKRGGIDEPLAIRALKRFVADREPKREGITRMEKTKGEKVAIIGSGPAGLAAAYDLARWGYGVTIFEALPFAGGMLRMGVPAFRLPREVLQAEIDSIFDLGVEIKYNTCIGKDLTLDDLFQKGYQAIFIAIGAHQGRKLGIPGENVEGVVDGISFMRDVNLGGEVKLGEKVMVIGGGSIAMDVARSALRLRPKEVHIACLESREGMPAHNWEIEEAEYEGVRFHYSVSPIDILGEDGKVAGIKFVGVKSIEVDSMGRIRPITTRDSEFSLDIDTVIVAIGQSPVTSVIGEGDGLRITELGTFDVDAITLATGRPGIFAGGDAASVKASAIEAMAAGKKAASSIDNYLRKRYLREEYRDLAIEPAPVEETIYPEQIERIKRNKMPALSLEERMDNFHVFELGFSEEMAIEEAKRCLKCGYCSVDQERCIGCGICRYVCPQQDVIAMEALVKVS